MSDAVSESETLKSEGAQARADQVRSADECEAAELAGVLPPNSLVLPRWLAPAAVLCAVLFIPWIAYLAVELPNRARTSHYALMWIGFDLGMWAVIVALAAAAWRRSTWTADLAVCAATLLVTDAWFDVVTADSRPRLMAAVASAVCLELPAAMICAWVAHNAERIRQRAYRRLFGWVATNAPRLHDDEATPAAGSPLRRTGQ